LATRGIRLESGTLIADTKNGAEMSSVLAGADQ
jgi:hypothetical protein